MAGPHASTCVQVLDFLSSLHKRKKKRHSSGKTESVETITYEVIICIIITMHTYLFLKLNT